MLLFVLMALPEKIEFDYDEFSMTMQMSRFIDRLYKSEMIISPYYTKDTKYEKNDKEK